MSQAVEKSDEQLMEDFIAGRAEAFDEIFDRYRVRIYGFIRSRLASRPAADDVLQETFFRIIKNAAQFRRGSRLRSWMFGIARNLCIDELRRTRREFLTADEPTSREPGPDPESQLRLSEDVQQLRRRIQALPPEQREVLILREYCELTFKEIAELQQCPLNTALGRMHDAMRKLKRQMTSPCTDEMS